MINRPTDEESDILERLRHPEREAGRRKVGKDLMVRNILNSVFILLAVVAMTGIVVASYTDRSLMVWYGLGLFAVLIKMIEVVLRMPGLRK